MGIRGRKIKRSAVFLDRDGTIIRQVELLHKFSQMRLFSDAAKSIKTFNDLGYFVIVITNQPVVARGIMTPKEVENIHRLLSERLKKRDARINAFYFCPHHPKANVKKYRVVCDCRKPAPGMILKAAKEHNIDLKKSFLIGDSTQDVAAGNRAKVRTILVRTGHGGKDQWQYEGRADFTSKDLSGTTRIIGRLSRHSV
jgi:D-glycero-D-manno-heptose 1,7-bisphosphate phosphatase